MVQLGNGQAIIGGDRNGYIQAKIHLLNCMNKNCSITTLKQELSVPRYWFLAIPIPDTITGCISGGKKCQKKVSDFLSLPSAYGRAKLLRTEISGRRPCASKLF